MQIAALLGPNLGQRAEWQTKAKRQQGHTGSYFAGQATGEPLHNVEQGREARC